MKQSGPPPGWRAFERENRPREKRMREEREKREKEKNDGKHRAEEMNDGQAACRCRRDHFLFAASPSGEIQSTCQLCEWLR